jgi:hypothetical protein
MMPIAVLIQAASVLAYAPQLSAPFFFEGSLRARRACRIRAAADPAADSQLFETLTESCGARSMVALRQSDLGRSLVASQDVEAGDVLMTIPNNVLLTAHRSGVIGGLIGQTDLVSGEVGDLRQEVGEEMFSKGATWDVRLAVAVLEATNGAGGPFWSDYRRLLPLPPQLTHPICLPVDALPELQDPYVVDEARRRSQLLSDVYPALELHANHPATASYQRRGTPLQLIPPPLSWAYSLVVSRCFALSDGDTFAFVPFLDMCQHSANPSANFTSDKMGFTLKALRSHVKGEPVTICYGDDYSSRRLFAQYGFTPAEGTAQDAQALATLYTEASEEAPAVLAEASTDPLSPKSMLAAFEIAKQSSPHATRPRLGAIFDALTDDEAPGPSVMLAAVTWKISTLPTTLEEDEAALTELEATLVSGSGAADPRLRAILEYRIGMKRLLSLTRTVLTSYPDGRAEDMLGETEQGAGGGE